jgi:repressor LexA
LDFIRGRIREHGVPPSSREIAAHFKFASPKAATDHIRALQTKGFLEVSPRSARNIRLTTPAAGIPILGSVPAGPPLEAVENRQDTLNLAQMFGTPEELFAVKVQGTSMINAGILDGDYVIVRQQPRVPNGTIAVAYINGEATVKRVFRTDQGYHLQPENPSLRPIKVTPRDGEFRIGGLVVGVIRAARQGL